MVRARVSSIWVLTSLLLVGAPSLSRAGDDEPASAPRARLSEQLTAELGVISKALETVSTKLADADAVRAARLRAAYRAVRAPVRPNASAEDRLVVARRRAATRLLATRDRDERALLAEERAHLESAAQRTVTAASRLPRIRLPEAIARPAVGPIVRSYGVVDHGPSGATLSRRGLDLAVATRAEVRAPAAGTVRYVGPMRGLETGMIIDHGEYFTVLAKLGDVVIATGAHVDARQVVGRAARERVYLEVRVKLGPGGIPIDPEPLLAR